MHNADENYEKLLGDVDKLSAAGLARAAAATKVARANTPEGLGEVIASVDADAVAVRDNLLKEAQRKEAARADKAGAAVHIVRVAQQLTR